MKKTDGGFDVCTILQQTEEAKLPEFKGVSGSVGMEESNKAVLAT